MAARSSSSAGGDSAPPLAGIRVLELAGLAPGPFAGMVLADYGADVVKIANPKPGPPDVLSRGKRVLHLDLKQADDNAKFLTLCAEADVCIDPFRPGVLESLGLGPDVLRERNPRLVLARLTGYGQHGPLASRAGHDINYLAEAGTLSLCGGGLLCVSAIMMALFRRERTGSGDVIDVSMVEGSSYLTTFVHRFAHIGLWDSDAPGTNLLDGGAPFYGTYECKDGRYLAVGPVEPKFFVELLGRLGVSQEWSSAHMDEHRREALSAVLAAAIRARTRDEWAAVLADSDACATPVRTLAEAARSDHAVQRGSFGTDSEGCTVPVPAPRMGSYDSREALEHRAAAERVGWESFRWQDSFSGPGGRKPSKL